MLVIVLFKNQPEHEKTANHNSNTKLTKSIIKTLTTFICNTQNKILDFLNACMLSIDRPKLKN